jgi:cytochrome c-type biogenesis protein CcmE
MTRKKRRMVILLVCGVGLASATALILSAFSDNLVFFVSPTDLAKSIHSGRQVRLGGLVEQGTVEKSTGGQAGAQFKVTDGNASVKVVYKGILPDLFREGQGVVVLGVSRLGGAGQARRNLHAEGSRGRAEEVRPLEPLRRAAATGLHLEPAGETARAVRLT